MIFSAFHVSILGLEGKANKNRKYCFRREIVLVRAAYCAGRIRGVKRAIDDLDRSVKKLEDERAS
jgi:hypothetical protein